MTGAEFRAARQAAGLSQKALAAAAGVAWTQIQKIEAGTIQIGNVTLRTAVRLADALGVPLAGLYSQKET